MKFPVIYASHGEKLFFQELCFYQRRHAADIVGNHFAFGFCDQNDASGHDIGREHADIDLMINVNMLLKITTRFSKCCNMLPHHASRPGGMYVPAEGSPASCRISA
jgi:hypothetical protein